MNDLSEGVRALDDGKGQEAGAPPETEPAETPREVGPTQLQVVVHSTPAFQNESLVHGALNGLAARFDLRRVIAEEGSAVATYARRWCLQRKVKLVVVLKDPAVAEREDRARRWTQVAQGRPHTALFFNQAGRWLEAAGILHGRGCPVTLVQPNDENMPVWVAWKPGMTGQGLGVPSAREIGIRIRRGRGRRSSFTPEERAQRRKDYQASWRKGQRMARAAMGGKARRPKGKSRRSTKSSLTTG